MAGRVNSVDDFINHRGSTMGKSNFLKWKKDGVGRVTVWMHMSLLPQPVWIHPFIKVVVRTDEKTRKQETRVWMDRLVCHEDEDVLKEYKKDRSDPEVRAKLTHCGMCRFDDWLMTQIKSGKLDPLKPVFHFKSDNDDETKLFHAGGLVGLINDEYVDSLDEEGKDRLKKAGVSLRYIFGENTLAKLNYIFGVVNESDTAAGVQLAIEPELLGDKVKMVIHKARKSKGSEAGDPFKNPYAIEWEANAKARKINEKYEATMIESVKLTPIVKRLITGPVPSIKHMTKPFDQATLRAFLERHCMLKGVPWDDIFKVEERGAEPEPEVDPDMEFPPEGADADDDVPFDQPASAPSVGASDSSPSAADDDELYECAVCGKGSVDPLLCTHCGAKYDEAGKLTFDPRAKPEEPKMRKRGGAKADAPKNEAPPTASKGAEPESNDAGDPLPWG